MNAIDFSILQNSSENPTLLSILLTVMFTVVLSSFIVLTYDLTTRAINRPLHFLQSMALISIVAATVMQAVGDSLARGLGMLGALAIIRFRTTLKNPRNITFMFASLAIGIACGVAGYEIAIIGTLVFCLVAIVLRFSPFYDKQELTGDLRFKMLPDKFLRAKAEGIIEENSKDFRLTTYKFDTMKEVLKEEVSPIKIVTADVTNEEKTTIAEKPLVREINIIEIRYQLKLDHLEQSNTVMESLMALEGIRGVKLSFNEYNVEL